MSCNLVLAPSFPELLDHCLDDIQKCCQQDRLGPKWIVTPTSTAAYHLRLRVGQRAGPAVFSGVRVIPLLSFIRHLSRKAEQQLVGDRWGPAFDLLLFELVEQLPSSSPLMRLKSMHGGYALLRPTFLDLADGGFGLSQIEILEELAEEPDLTHLEGETIRLFMSWIQAVEKHRLNWEPLLHQKIPEWIMHADEHILLSSLVGEKGQIPRVLVYGFYGFTDVNAQFIAALGRRIDLTLYYPFLKEEKQLHPTFDFSQPILEDLKVRLGTALEETGAKRGFRRPGTGDVSSELSRRRSTHFFLSTFPEGEIPAQPSFLTFQRASGIRAEVISAAVRVRQWIDHAEHPMPLEEILLVAPDPQPYSDLIREVFADFAIPLRMVDAPAGLTPESRALRMLARIWEDRAPAEWVLAYLRDYPEIAAARDVDVDQLESKVRLLGVWAESSWQLILQLKQNRSDLEERSLPTFTTQERTLVKEILDLWGAGSTGAQPILTLRQATHFLTKIATRWLPSPALLHPLLEALKLTESSRPDLKIKAPLLREMFRQVIPDQMQTDPLDRPAVLLLPLMRARSLTSRGLVLFGLAAGTWPSRIEEDPLLSDASRGRLMAKARDVGHLLAIKSHITEEMSLLFFLLNTSAVSIHWVIPETDDTGRSVAPTPWVQRYIQSWERASETKKMWSRIPRGPAQQGEYLFQLNVNTGSFLPPDFLAFAEPAMAGLLSREIPYGYLVEASQLRGRELTWNGHIPSASLPASGVGEERVRVTDLEILAKCPYRFYANCRVEWKPLTPLPFADQMSALDWGSLVHSFLEHLIRPSLEKRAPVLEIARAMLRSEARGLDQAAGEFASRLPKPLRVLPELFRQVAVAKLVETVKDYFLQVVDESCGGDVPIEIELKRRVPFPGLEGLKISGQIDRIDEHNGGHRIYDYKSGRSLARKQLDLEMLLGHRIQPILYPWIFSRETSGQSESAFSFIFLGDSPPGEQKMEYPLEVEDFLQPLGEILRDGMFLPTPTETLQLHQIEEASPCSFCHYISLCRRFDHGARYRYFQFSQKQLLSRIKAMTAAAKRHSSKR